MGVVVGGVIDEVQDRTVGIIVENRTDHSHMLPAGKTGLCVTFLWIMQSWIQLYVQKPQWWSVQNC